MKHSLTSIPSAFLAVALLLPGVAAAQAGAPEGSPPPGWKMLTDDVGADPAEITFVAMEPGFHVTTGPAALFYDPSHTGAGALRVEASVHLFEPGDGERAFGLFVGGSDLEGSYQRYTSFLLRPSGEYSVVRRLSLTSSETLVDWTPSDEVVAWSDREEGEATVLNTLAVEVRDGGLVFLVNGREVDRVAPGTGGEDGVAGLRVEDGVNIHVTEFDVAPL